MKIAASQGPGVLLKLPLMHRQQLRKKAPQPLPSGLTDRVSRRPTGYLKTRIRGSRLLNAARILALVELTHRLHQAYTQAYDKQAAEWLLPQNPPQGPAPATIPCTFNIDITGSGLTADELGAAVREVQEIFGAAGFLAVFGNPLMANGGSVSLNISTNFPRQARANPGENGVAIRGGGRAWVSVTNTVTYNGQVQARTAAIRGLAVGRVGAHETTHALGRGHGPGLMRRGFGIELFDPNADNQFRLSPQDIAGLAARCQPRRR